MSRKMFRKINRRTPAQRLADCETHASRWHTKLTSFWLNRLGFQLTVQILAELDESLETIPVPASVLAELVEAELESRPVLLSHDNQYPPL